ncbi:hypothetical protein D3C80_2210200 [compost metagenome]
MRTTVGPGEIIIRDKDKQAELEASEQTEDLASLNRDPDKAYEITKDMQKRTALVRYARRRNGKLLLLHA